MTISSSLISKTDIADMLAKIKSMSTQTTAIEKPALGKTNSANFQSLMAIAKQSIAAVNTSQNQTDSLKNAYMIGDPNTSLSQVMMSSIKSKVAFEGLLVVRNKLIDAYKEIMNMPL